MTGRTGPSGSDLFVRAGFVQLLQKGAASVRMCNTESEELSGWLGHNNGRHSFSISVENGVETILEVAAKIDDLLLRLPNYIVPKKIMERRPSEQNVIVKSITASVKQLEM